MVRDAGPDRYSVESLKEFASEIFQRAGLSADRARTMSTVLLEGDLLGFSTHGYNLVPRNLRWLADGTSNAEGQVETLYDSGNCINVDANFVPGPVAVNELVQLMLERVSEHGLVTAVMRRSQHIACLAAHLVPVLEANCVGLICCSTPSERNVVPSGSRERLFSVNPLAFAAPAGEKPLLFDFSMSTVSGGRIARAKREGWRFTEDVCLDRDGVASREPDDVYSGLGMLPLGGQSHGYKGSALSAMIEVLSMALGGYGRASDVGSDGESNSVFLQLVSPGAFGFPNDFGPQAETLRRLWGDSARLDRDTPVRVPGTRAWETRADQLRDGVCLYPNLLDDIAAWAQRYDVELPVSIEH